MGNKFIFVLLVIITMLSFSAFAADITLTDFPYPAYNQELNESNATWCYNLNDNGNDNCGTNDGSVNAAYFTNTPVNDSGKTIHWTGATNSILELPSGPWAMSDNWSIAWWYNGSASNNNLTSYRFAGSKNSAGDDSFGFSLSLSNGSRLQLSVGGVSSATTTIAYDIPNGILDGQWHHYVITHSNGVAANNFSFYFDGNNVTTSTIITNTGSTYNPSGLAWPWGAYRSQAGLFDASPVGEFDELVIARGTLWSATHIQEVFFGNITIDTIAPNVTQINFTSDGGAICLWPTLCATTEDITPTFVLTTDENARCRCGYQDVDYDSMPTDATGNDTTELTCTQASSAPFGFNISYFGCVDSLGNNNTAPINDTNKANLSIQDLTAPNINFTAPTPANYSNITINSIFANFTASDNFNLVEVNISLYNSTDYVNSSVNTTAGLFEFDFTNLSKDTYFLNATATDGSFNTNSTETRQYFLEIPLPNMTLDGIKDNRTYEYQTTANITFSLQYLNILDDTGRYLNQITSPFLYLIDLLRFNKFNESLETIDISDTKIAYFFSDVRNNFYNTTFNISSYSEIEDLFINYTDSSTNRFISIPGYINGVNVEQDEFIFNDVNYTIINLSYSLLGSKIIYVNYSCQGLPNSRNGSLNFTITGYDIDQDNEFDTTQDFHNLDIDNDTLDSNITIFGAIQDFEDNATTGWSMSSGSGTLTVSEDADGHYLDMDLSVFPANAVWQEGLTKLDVRKTSIVNLSLVSKQSWSCPNGMMLYMSRTILLTDGSSSITLWTNTNNVGCAGGDSGSTVASLNLSMEINHTSKNINVYLFNSFYNTVSYASLDTSIKPYLKFQASHSDTSDPGVNPHSMVSNFHLYQINVSGISLQMVQSNFSTELEANYTTESLFIAPTNISGAILNTTTIEPSLTNIVYYLSNNGGQTFELVTSGSRHSFISIGNNLSARFTLSTTDETVSSLIYSYSVIIDPLTMTGLIIDVGNDGTNDMETGVLNSSTTPLSYNGSDTPFNQYIENSSSCETTLVPIKFTALSPGQIQIDNLNITQNINPILLNSSFINPSYYLNFTSSGLLNIFDIRFDFYGRKNITIQSKEGTVEFNRTLSVEYSIFNTTINPPNINYWDISPNIYSYNQSEIVPFGNANGNGNPFFNITSPIWDHKIDIYIKYNESVNSCATTWFSGINRTDSTTFNVTLNTSSKLLIDNMEGITQNNNISTWTNLSCASSNSSLIIPYFCFQSICSDCVKTYDWDSNCDWIK